MHFQPDVSRLRTRVRSPLARTGDRAGGRVCFVSSAGRLRSDPSAVSAQNTAPTSIYQTPSHSHLRIKDPVPLGAPSSTLALARLLPLNQRLENEREQAEQREQRGDGECGLEVVFVVDDLDMQRERVGEAADVAGDD